MQFKHFFLALCALTLIFSACKKDDEVIITPPVERDPFLIHAIVDNSNTLIFPFEACSLFNGGTENSFSTKGTSRQDGVDYYTRRFRTTINEDNGGNSNLEITLELIQAQTEGAMTFGRIEELVESEIHNTESEYLNFKIVFEIDDIRYKNQSSDFRFNHPDDYSFEITEYEFNYTEECLAIGAIKLKGNFKGTFSDYKFGEPVESIYIEVPDFEVMLLL